VISKSTWPGGHRFKYENLAAWRGKCAVSDIRLYTALKPLNLRFGIALISACHIGFIRFAEFSSPGIPFFRRGARNSGGKARRLAGIGESQI
jgi:hypothetical protein